MVAQRACVRRPLEVTERLVSGAARLYYRLYAKRVALSNVSADAGANFTMAQLRDCHVEALRRILVLACGSGRMASSAIWDDDHEVYVALGSAARLQARHAWSTIAAAVSGTRRAVVLSDTFAAVELRGVTRRCRGMLAMWDCGNFKGDRSHLLESMATIAEAQCDLYRGVVATRIAILDVAAQAATARSIALPASLPRGAIFVFDRDLRYRVAEGELIERWGGSPRGGIIGRTLREVVSAANHDFLERVYSNTLQGEALRFEVSADGCTYEGQSVPVLDASGQVYEGVLLVHDVTALRRLESQLLANAR